MHLKNPLQVVPMKAAPIGLRHLPRLRLRTDSEDKTPDVAVNRL